MTCEQKWWLVVFSRNKCMNYGTDLETLFFVSIVDFIWYSHTQTATDRDPFLSAVRRFWTFAERLHEAPNYLDIPVKYTGDKTRCESNLFLFGLDAAKQRAIWQSAGWLNTVCRLLRHGSSCPLSLRELRPGGVQSVSPSIDQANLICTVACVCIHSLLK